MKRVAVFVASWLHAAAFAAGVVQISGSSTDVDVGGDSVSIVFTCLGAPTCTGTYTSVSKLPECNVPIAYTGVFSVTGVNLSGPGTFGGTIFFDGADLNAHSDGHGNCSPTYAPLTAPYNAGWDGHNGSITITAPDGTLTASFSANVSSAPPVFPMEVTGSITPATANIAATIQPRSQDAGQSVAIFVFAHAPKSRVNGAKRAPAQSLPALQLDDADPCVLAQVDANGNLNAVTASTMQSYATGVISSQGQAVNVLNNVSTPNVAGASMYVGYGANASAMLANGVYQGAVTVPGNATCRTALATASAPASTGPMTGLWWNANESGWGLHLTQRGSNVFAAWYTYDSAGKPKWYVATCAGASGASGTCNGTLYQVTGPNFFGGGFNPGQVVAANAGTLTLNFSNANAATMTFTVGSVTRANIAITRQPLGSGTTPPAVDFSDIWWNASESGWGAAMAQQFGTAFLAWYVYDNAGKPTWLVATCTMSGTACTGTLYRTTGPALGPTFNPAQVAATQAGTVIVTFTDANNATIDYIVDGVPGTKAVTRQLF
jgi:hypothetical protein